MAVASTDDAPSATTTKHLPRLWVPRAGQLDAINLDSQLLTQFRENFIQTLSIIPTFMRWASRYDLELDALLRAFLLAFTSLQYGATIGMQLNNLSFRHPRTHVIPYKRLVIKTLVWISGPYVWARLSRHMAQYQWSDHPPTSYKAKLYRLVRLLEPLWLGASVINQFHFYITGQYSNLTDLLFKLSMYPTQSHLNRYTSHGLMYQQVLWTAFTDSILFILPLYRSFRPSLLRLLCSYPKLSYINLWLKGKTGGLQDHITSQKEDICPKCAYDHQTIDQNPSNIVGLSDKQLIGSACMPVYGSCGCQYCYMCAQFKIIEHKQLEGRKYVDESKERFMCIRCNMLTMGPFLRL